MKYSDLSKESKDVLLGMVEFCIDLGCCMGMDEGIAQFEDDDHDEIKHPFRLELEAFIKSNQP